MRFLALLGLWLGEAVGQSEQDNSENYASVNYSFYGPTKWASSKRKIPYLDYLKPLPKTYKAFARATDKHGIVAHTKIGTDAYHLKQ